MTILVDTDVLVAFINRHEAKHEHAMRLMGQIVEGKWGAPFVTDYVMDESLTLLMARGAPPQLAERLLRLVFVAAAPSRPPPLPLVRVTDTAFRGAIPLFRRHYGRGLSFTDCTSLSLIDERRIDSLASFDRGFDGLARRLQA